MSDSKQILPSGPAPKSPTDEQIAEFERLIHVACAATMRFKAHPSFENATARRNAVAMVSAHQANFFEGETVAA